MFRTRLAVSLSAAFLVLVTGAASAEDCAPLVAAVTNRQVPFTAFFISSGPLPSCAGIGCPAPLASPQARALAARERPDLIRAQAQYHLWTGRHWYFWIERHGWHRAEDYHPEPLGALPRDLKMTCRPLREEVVNGEAAILHEMRGTVSGMPRGDELLWLSKATGLMLKSVNRETGGREFVQILNYKDVPVLADAP